jgi:hypothetical protein
MRVGDVGETAARTAPRGMSGRRPRLGVDPDGVRLAVRASCHVSCGLTIALSGRPRCSCRGQTRPAMIHGPLERIVRTHCDHWHEYSPLRLAFPARAGPRWFWHELRRCFHVPIVPGAERQRTYLRKWGQREFFAREGALEVRPIEPVEDAPRLSGRSRLREAGSFGGRLP